MLPQDRPTALYQNTESKWPKSNGQRWGQYSNMPQVRRKRRRFFYRFEIYTVFSWLFLPVPVFYQYIINFRVGQFFFTEKIPRQKVEGFLGTLPFVSIHFEHHSKDSSQDFWGFHNNNLHTICSFLLKGLYFPIRFQIPRPINDTPSKVIRI